MIRNIKTSRTTQSPFRRNSGFRKVGITAVGWLLLASVTLFAHPEFQEHIVRSTGRPVNCAMCHANPDGPEGTATGQIGRLDAAELGRLGRARAAFEPGQKVDSPILNAFGNHMIEVLGKNKVSELRTVPEALPDLLPQKSDLDGDGIPDAKEIRDGTHPLNRHDGNPWLLFQHNFKTNLTAIALTLAATVAGMYGLKHLLNAFAIASQARKMEDEDE